MRRAQTYLFFYDKLEKANYFLENIIATAKTADQDSRLLAELLSAPINDGGQVRSGFVCVWFPCHSWLRKWRGGKARRSNPF